MIDLILNILKFLSTALGGICGVIAVFNPNNRKKDGSFTPSGKAALAGVMASTIVIGTIQLVEILRQRAEAFEEAQKARETIEEIRSPLMPPGRMMVSFEILLKLEHPMLENYRRRIQTLVKPVLGTEKPPFTPPDTEWYFHTDISNRTAVSSVMFGRSSPVYPQAEDHPHIREIFGAFGIEASIFTSGPTNNLARFVAFPREGQYRLWFDPAANTLEMEVKDVELRSGESWETYGGMTSLVDFNSKRLTVGFIGFDWGSDSQNSLSFELQKFARIKRLVLFVANRRLRFECQQKDFGESISFILPPNIMEWNFAEPFRCEELNTNSIR